MVTATVSPIMRLVIVLVLVLVLALVLLGAGLGVGLGVGVDLPSTRTRHQADRIEYRGQDSPARTHDRGPALRWLERATHQPVSGRSKRMTTNIPTSGGSGRGSERERTGARRG
jgi:hypothetical protein